MADPAPDPRRPDQAAPTPSPAPATRVESGTAVGNDPHPDTLTDPAAGSTFPPEARDLLAALHLPTATPEPSPPPGWQIPGYEIRGELARGGMGVVLRATDAALGREVAVKVLLDKYGPGSAAARRFVDEARITAQLQHPGIPPVHELGTLPDGRPFLAMKLIKGQTLDALLAGGQVNEPAAPNLLAVFEGICQAVGYAHAHHVIHRDLKPSNVMVGSFGEVQVMDWGLAKVLGDRPGGDVPGDSAETVTVIDARPPADGSATRTGSVLGTLAFMPPEQAAGVIGMVDARSDVFGLGAILCVILTGRPPYRGDSAEAVRLLAARGNLADAFARLDACGADAELVALAKRCLAPDPADRPADAGAVAAQVAALRTAADERAKQAELDRVRAEGEREKAEAEAREQAKRRRAVQWAAGAVAAVLVLGIAGTSAGLVRANRAQAAEAERAEGERTAKLDADARRAEAEREKARAEANERLAGERLVEAEAEKRRAEEQERVAQATRDFLRFKLLRPAGARGQADILVRAGSSEEVKLNPPIRDLLDRAAEELAADKIEASFPGRPLVQAELLATVGDTYLDLGEARLAIGFLERAAGLREAHQGPAHPDALAARHTQARAYHIAGRRPEATALYRQVYKRQAATLGEEDPATLKTLNSLGVAYRSASNYPDAIRLFRRVHESFVSLGGESDLRAMTALDNLAWTLRESGRAKEAIPLHERVLAARVRKLVADHPDTLETRSNLAEAYAADGQLDKAIELFEQARAGREKVLGADHPKTLTTLNGLAVAYFRVGRHDDAIRLHQRVSELRTARQGPDHPNTLISRQNVASAYKDSGRPAEAIPLFEQLRGPFEKVFGPDQNPTLVLLGNLAKAYWAVGRLGDALPLFELVAQVLEKRRFQYQHARAMILDAADAYVAAGEFDKAEGWRRKWLGFVRERDGAESPGYAGELAAIGLKLLDQRQWPAAEAALRECLTIWEKTQPEVWSTFATASLVGEALVGQRKYAEAEPLLLKGYEGMKQRETAILAGNRALLPRAIDRLVELYAATDRPDEAARWKAERAGYPEVAPPPREKK